MYDTDGLVPPVAKRARIDYNTNYEQASRTTTHPILLPPQLVDIQLNKRTNEGEQPNHVLLFTVLNPTYPITVGSLTENKQCVTSFFLPQCDVLHTITSPFGKLIRIVIFKKNGVQAMLEFDSLESAQRAKDALHGCDIYSACCTLKIEYAKPSKLNVYKNDTESCDYTNPMLGKGTMVEQPPPPGLQHQRPVLLKEPLVAGQDQVIILFANSYFDQRFTMQTWYTPLRSLLSELNHGLYLLSLLPRWQSRFGRSSCTAHRACHPQQTRCRHSSPSSPPSRAFRQTLSIHPHRPSPNTPPKHTSLLPKPHSHRLVRQARSPWCTALTAPR